MANKSTMHCTKYAVSQEQKNAFKNMQADFLEFSHDAVIAWNLNGSIVYWNKAAEKLFGYSKEEAEGCICHELFKAVYPGGFNTYLEDLVKNGAWNGEVEYVAKDGEKLFVETRKQVFTDDMGCRIVLETNRDLIKHKKLEMEISKVNSYITEILESISNGYFSLNSEWQILYGNRKAANNVGFEPDELQNKIIWDMFPSFKNTEIETNFRKVMCEKIAIRFEWSGVITKKHYEFNVYPTRDGIAVYWLDISENKKQKEVIERAYRMNTEILESISDGFYSLNSEWRFTYVNRRAAKNLGYDPDELLNKNIWDMFPMFRNSGMEDNFKKAMAQKISVNTEFTGTLTGTQYNCKIYPTAEGIAVYWLDITEEKKARAELKQQKDLLETVIENIPTGIAIYNNDGVNKMNAAWRKSYPDLSKKTTSKLDNDLYQTYDFNNNYIPLEKLSTIRAIKGEKVRNEKIMIRFKDKEIYTEVTAIPIVDENSNLVSLVVCHHDITEQVKNEEVNKYHANLLEHVSDAIVSIDNDYIITSWNRSAELMYGWKSEETIGKQIDTLLHTKFVSMSLDEIRSKLAKDGGYETEVLHTAKDGRKLNVILTASNVKNSSGDIIGRVGLLHNVTERKRMEEELKAGKELLETVIENIPDGIAIYNSNGDIISLNAEWRKSFDSFYSGIADDSVNVLYQCFDSDGNRISFENFPTLCAFRGEKIRNQKVLTRYEDMTRYTEVSAAPIFNDRNELISAVVIHHDITEQVKNDEAIRYHANLLEQVSDAVLSTDNDYNIMSWNRSAEQIFGWKAEEAIGKNIESLFQGQFVTMEPEEAESILMKEGSCEVEIVNKNKEGKKLNIISNVNVVKNGKGETIGRVAIMHDITERKRMEEELKAGKDLLEAVIENIPEAISIYDFEGGNLILNAAWRKAYPDYSAVSLKSERNTFIHYDFNNNPIPFKQYPTMRALKGEKLTNEKIIISYENKLKYAEVNATPIFNDDKDLATVVISHHDITELVKNQKLVEEQKELMLQKEKEKNEILSRDIEMKDEFISLISHEFKTPITVINASVQAMEFLCKDELTEREKVYLNKIRQNSDRQLRLVNNLLEAARANTGNITINNRNTDIVKLTGLILYSIVPYAEQKGIKLTFHSSFEEKIIGIDDEKYERILLNLLSNAVKFTPGGKSISIRLSLIQAGRKSRICVQVSDEGIGISVDKQRMIFEKFGRADSSRTRHTEGTGIGLYLVKKLVELMGGEIALESKKGKGSTFTVLLPAKKAKESSESRILNEYSDVDLLNSSAIEFSDIT